MHEHKSKMSVPPTHEVLYRLQISQHQLQKDVTHQLSRFLVNRRDDEADLSDMVHIFFRSGFFSHGVLLSQMQNKIIVLPYDLGTKCPKVFLKGGSDDPSRSINYFAEERLKLPLIYQEQKSGK